MGHSLGKIRDTYVNLGSEVIMATASQETADWIAAAMAGEKVKPGVKVAKVEMDQAGTADAPAPPRGHARRRVR